jgi:hypothetical protein
VLRGDFCQLDSVPKRPIPCLQLLIRSPGVVSFLSSSSPVVLVLPAETSTVCPSPVRLSPPRPPPESDDTLRIAHRPRPTPDAHYIIQSLPQHYHAARLVPPILVSRPTLVAVSKHYPPSCSTTRARRPTRPTLPDRRLFPTMVLAALSA